MQKGHSLQFKCLDCGHPIQFSVFELEKPESFLVCEHCSKKYVLNDPILQRQLRKFELLCKQIVDSEEILSNTSVGVDVGNHHVKIPYKLLLARLTSVLELNIEGKSVSIEFRIEPTQDLSSE